MLRRLAPLLVLSAVLSTAAEEAAPALPSPDADPFPVATAVVEVVQPGRWRWRVPKLGTDPLAPVEGLDAAAVAKWSDKQVKERLDADLARLQAWLVAKGSPTPEFIAWLEAHPDLRRDLLLAVDWRYDDPAGVVLVLDGLRTAHPKQVEKLGQLAVAMAVVWDQPDAIPSSRNWCIWGIQLTQFPQIQQAKDVFAWFADERNQARFVFKPSQLPWPLMVHMVDIDISPAEMAWVLARPMLAKDLAALYPSVPYDNDKLARKPPKLGAQPYTLANLLSIGGVCGDQGHYASRVAKTLGVPAMKVAGEGRFGGDGHAWCGYLVAEKGRPVLQFTGRYFFDYYYTGTVFDPQTRTFTLDRYVALGYDGISVSSASAQSASYLARLAMACMAADRPLAVALARKAVDRNRYCADGWRVITELGGDGAIPRAELDKLLTRLLKDLTAHPDITFEAVLRAVRCIPEKDVDDRQRLWNAAFALYAERPDLQIKLRMRQCSELGEAGRGIEGTELALKTVVANAKEGTLILPLVQHVVESSLRFSRELKNFRMAFVKEQLAKADAAFPKQRGSTASPAYAEFRAQVAKLP